MPLENDALFSGDAMNLVFDESAIADKTISTLVSTCLGQVKTLEESKGAPILIFQDGKSKAYYIRCTVLAQVVSPFGHECETEPH